MKKASSQLLPTSGWLFKLLCCSKVIECLGMSGAARIQNKHLPLVYEVIGLCGVSEGEINS